MKKNTTTALLYVLSLGCSVAIVVLQDPGLRADASRYLHHLSARAHAAMHPADDVPPAADLSAVLARAHEIKEGA